MEGDGHNFMAQLQASSGHMDGQQGFAVTSTVQGFQPGMHMNPQSMPFAHPMMVPGGHFVHGFGTQQPMHQPMHPMHQQQPMHPMHHQQAMHQQPDQVVEEDIEVENSQQDEDVEEVAASQFTENEGRKKGASHRGSGFRVEEDRVIVSGWLNVSKDATTGTNQDRVAFYKRLWQYFVDNYDPNSKRTEYSIQKRWSTIQSKVSKFCELVRRVERLNQSGLSYHDMINEAIKDYQKKEPWKFGHCWEMLKDEPKWNDKLLEILQPGRGQQQKQDGQPSDSQQKQDGQPSENDSSSMPTRPEGRDAAKRRRQSKLQDTSSNSVAVDMLKQLNDRGQQMDEIESKQKEELINIQRAKFELAQKQLQVKLDISSEANKMTRELTMEKLKLQKEMKEAELKVKMHAIDVEQTKVDTQIMFTDTSKLSEGLREWVLKRQMDIMIRDGVRSAGGASSSNSDGGRP